MSTLPATGLSRRTALAMERLVSSQSEAETSAAFKVYDSAVRDLGELPEGMIVDLLADNFQLPLERCRELTWYCINCFRAWQ